MRTRAAVAGIVACAAVLTLSPAVALAARVPEANFDGGYSCGDGGGSVVVWVTREYRWPGRVKIWDGKPFVREHLRRVVTYRDLANDGDFGGVVVGELRDGVHRLRSTYRGRVLDRLRIRIDCV